MNVGSVRFYKRKVSLQSIVGDFITPDVVEAEFIVELTNERATNCPGTTRNNYFATSSQRRYIGTHLSSCATYYGDPLGA